MRFRLECEACGEFDAYFGCNDAVPPCECGKPAKRLIEGAPSYKLLGCGWAQDGYQEVSHPRWSSVQEGTRRGDK